MITLQKINLKHKLSFLLVYLLIEGCSLNALSTNSFCKRTPEKRCMSNDIKNHSMKCENEACQEPFIYKCGQNKCVKSKAECEQYLNYEKFVNSYIVKALRRFDFYFSENHKKYCAELVNWFKLFERNMASCPSKADVLQLGDVCISGKICFKLLKEDNFERIQNVTKTECPCIGKLAYRCTFRNKRHCTLNEKVCDLFKINYTKIRKNKLKKTLNKCNNNFLFIEK